MVVRFFASIRSVTGVREIAWEQPTPTLGELLRHLSERYGPAFRRWVLDGEDLGSSVMVVINGDDARHRGGSAAQLGPTDVISILPIMAGGVERAELSAISVQFSANTGRDLGPAGTEARVDRGGRVSALS
jgi:MoaD family protein